MAAQQSNAVTFLWKPFRTEDLLNAVAQGLALYDQQSH
jgi:FixJ family two-component response regulator